jgi:hypothetical protein
VRIIVDCFDLKQHHRDLISEPIIILEIDFSKLSHAEISFRVIELFTPLTVEWML